MLTREFVGNTVGQNWHYVYHEHRTVPFMWHYHPEFELTFTRGARGIRYVGGDVKRFDELDLVLVAPNQAHTWSSHSPQEDTRIQVVFFTLDWLRRLAENGLPELTVLNEWLFNVREGVVFSSTCINELLPSFDKLHQQCGLARLATLAHILEALPHDRGARHIGSLSGPHGSDQRLDVALAFLHENYLRPISLEAIAQTASTSASTIKRLFHAHLSMGVSELLIQLRVGHACHLLVSTDLPVGLSAGESGFPNPGHFFALFRRKHGMSPAEFRRRYHLRTRSGLP